jgi:predicted RNA-binding Zn ribbon-like protein
MANSAAPGKLELVRSFVNTIEPEDETDLLQANGELPQWCNDTGLCPNVDEEGLARLRGFREALRDVLESHAGGDAEAERWLALEPYAASSCYRISVAGDGMPALRPQGSGTDYAISAILGIVYDAIREGTWRRLKACRKQSCRWAFYDLSKNESGAWCSMRSCGNRVKAARRRAREKAR